MNLVTVSTVGKCDTRRRSRSKFIGILKLKKVKKKKLKWSQTSDIFNFNRLSDPVPSTPVRKKTHQGNPFASGEIPGRFQISERIVFALYPSET